MPKAVERVTIPCANPDCAKPMHVRPKMISKTKYCSWDCKSKGQTKPRTTLRCNWCNGKFDVWPSDLDRKYCSEICDYRSRAGRSWPVHRKVQVKKLPTHGVHGHRAEDVLHKTGSGG